MAKNTSVYQEILEVTEDYLGPATQRFVDRQIQVHLQKDPHKLTQRDAKKLIEWLKISLAFITEDRLMLEQYSNRLLNTVKMVNEKPRNDNKKR